MTEERRSGYIEINSKLLLLEKDMQYIRQFVDEDRITNKEWVDSLRKHNAKLMYLQGYEDRINEKLSIITDSLDRHIKNDDRTFIIFRWLIGLVLSVSIGVFWKVLTL